MQSVTVYFLILVMVYLTHRLGFLPFCPFCFLRKMFAIACLRYSRKSLIQALESERDPSKRKFIDSILTVQEEQAEKWGLEIQHRYPLPPPTGVIDAEFEEPEEK